MEATQLDEQAKHLLKLALMYHDRRIYIVARTTVQIDQMVAEVLRIEPRACPLDGKTIHLRDARELRFITWESPMLRVEPGARLDHPVRLPGADIPLLWHNDAVMLWTARRRERQKQEEDEALAALRKHEEIEARTQPTLDEHAQRPRKDLPVMDSAEIVEVVRTAHSGSHLGYGAALPTHRYWTRDGRYIGQHPIDPGG